MWTMIKKWEPWRNFLIFCFYYSGLAWLRYLYLKIKYKKLTRIIAFHQIKDLEIELFEEKIKLLKEKYNIVSLHDFLNNNLDTKKLNLVITFDDGYKKWFSNVVPILEKYNIPAVFLYHLILLILKQKNY